MLSHSAHQQNPHEGDGCQRLTALGTVHLSAILDFFIPAFNSFVVSLLYTSFLVKRSVDSGNPLTSGSCFWLSWRLVSL